MLTKFRERYPQGSLVSDLVKIDRGIYIVKASVQIDNIVLATGLAAADKIEVAEDKARERAIATLALDLHQTAAYNLKTEKSAVNSTLPDKLSNSKQMPSVLANTNSNIRDNNDSSDLSKPSPAIEPETSTAKIEPTIVSEPPPPEPFLEPENPEINLNPEPAINSGNLFEGTAAKEQYSNPLAENNITSQLPTSNVNLNPESEATETIDFNEIKQKTDIEIKRLGWTKDDGREFLKTRYGKRSRLHLTDEQLLEFLRYLEKEPTPVK